MSKAARVLKMLVPDAEWTSYGENYEDIVWKDDIALIDESEFKAGFKKLDKFEADKKAEEENKKAALLAKLGITEEEAKLLLS